MRNYGETQLCSMRYAPNVEKKSQSGRKYLWEVAVRKVLPHCFWAPVGFRDTVPAAMILSGTLRCTVLAGKQVRSLQA